jgi:aspartyl-tRNA(Asn)/glutamyl-tRNA(Gln) amidotransferase subunit A
VVASAFTHALRALEQEGALVETFSFPELLALPEMNKQGGLIAAEAWAWHRKLIDERETEYDPRVAARIRRGAQLSASDYIELLQFREKLIGASQRRLARFDAWLMPTVATTAPYVATLASDDNAFFSMNALVLRNSSVINQIDGCALSLPCHKTGEQAVGLSICGPSGTDSKILQVGRSIELLLNNARRR